MLKLKLRQESSNHQRFLVEYPQAKFCPERADYWYKAPKFVSKLRFYFLIMGIHLSY